MMRHVRQILVFWLVSGALLHHTIAQPTGNFIYGDPLPDAPELAERGSYKVGVRTLEVIHKDQVDVLRYAEDNQATYDRHLTLEIWYPARIPSETPQLTSYDEVMGQNGNPERPIIPFTFFGRATRDAPPILPDSPFPLVIVSHGYTGSRYLMTYLTENLASKGYVVVAIDHMESTFKDAGGFASTLLNRSLDDLFVLDEMARLTQSKSSFLNGLADPENTALIGYSMGGYGAVNVAGGGYSSEGVDMFSQFSSGSRALEKRMIGNPEFEKSRDKRIKVIVAMAPWGMERGFWNADGLAGIHIPSLFIAGSMDDISGYENGIKAIYEAAVNSDRYLLTYKEARHNIAPNPPPVESMKAGLHIDEYLRYADSVWDQRRINNINQHFITAFLGLHLKEKSDYAPYFEVPVDSDEEVWTGFKPRTSIGLLLQHQGPTK